MRLFVSVDLDDLSTAVAEAQEPLRDLPGLDPVDPEQAHVTMKFLGDADHDVAALTDAIERAIDAAEVAPFDATVEGLGVFPSLGYINVVWLGVETPDRELTRVHERLEAETAELGYDRDQHEFTPHATLARMKHAAAKEEVQHLVRERDPELGTVRVSELRLTESTLTPEGPVYETVERFEL